MKFEFVDKLPEIGGTGQDRYRVLVEFAAALLENPGQWAKYPTDIAKSSVYVRAGQINRGLISAFKGGKFEACVRQYVLYVRAEEEKVSVRRRRRA